MRTGTSRTRVRLFLCVLAATGAAAAATFAALRGDIPTPTAPRSISLQNTQSRSQSELNEDGYRLSQPGYKYSFPRDHGSHPEFQTEWWYYTGHLQSTRGQTFGYQLTFFRTAITPSIEKRKSKWATRDVIFAHLALTDEKGERFFFDDKISRGALGLAEAQKVSPAISRPKVWIDDWSMQFRGSNGNEQSFRAFGTSQHGAIPFGIELTQRAVKTPAMHGQNGVSQKSAGRGRASHYYSFTRLQSQGKVRIGDEEYSVSGESWFDHEFGSNQLSSEQSGWDWFSLQLDDGRELMLYQLRLKNNGNSDGIDPYSSGTLVEKDGSTRHLERNDFQIDVLSTWTSPASKAKYPSRWKITVPSQKIALEITPTVADQELDTERSTNITYWEGSVRAGGTQSGKGYVEMTGYAQQFDGTF